MGQVLRPDKVGELTVLSGTQVQLASSILTLGGQQYSTSTLTLSTGSTGLGGLDIGGVTANSMYFIYAVLSGGSVSLVASLSRSAPSGFSVYKRIGSFYVFHDSTISHFRNPDDFDPGAQTTEWAVFDHATNTFVSQSSDWIETTSMPSSGAGTVNMKSGFWRNMGAYKNPTVSGKTINTADNNVFSLQINPSSMPTSFTFRQTRIQSGGAFFNMNDRIVVQAIGIKG